MKSKVYFNKNISSDTLIKMYDLLGVKLEGKVAVKLHSGEDGNQNYVRPEFVKPIIEHVNGTVVECNTAYGDFFNSGVRDTTEGHKKLLEKHGWTKYFDVDIMDSEGQIEVDVENANILQKNLLGKNITNYDSMLVLSHFKGHPNGGFGGALKQLSIGCASSAGKARIHSAGISDDRLECWKANNSQDSFLESMADAASTVHKMFKGKIVYINMMVNLSVDCDCCGAAEDPCMKDIGILISEDPIAIDQACLDLIYSSEDPGRDHFVERVETRHGVHTIEAASKLGFGNREYELIEVED